MVYSVFSTCCQQAGFEHNAAGYEHSVTLQLTQMSCCVLAGPAAAVAAAFGDSAKAGRKLKQVTVFYDTPAAAGSTSVGLNANAAVSAVPVLGVGTPSRLFCTLGSVSSATSVWWSGLQCCLCLQERAGLQLTVLLHDGPFAAAAEAVAVQIMRTAVQATVKHLWFPCPCADYGWFLQQLCLIPVSTAASLQLRPDGTVQSATGASVTSSTGIANPL
jgi:hypothetical protein